MIFQLAFFRTDIFCKGTLNELIRFCLDGLDRSEDSSEKIFQAVCFALGKLPWFFFIPCQIYFIFLEYSTLFFKFKKLSRLPEPILHSYFRNIAHYYPLMSSVLKLVRTLALLAFYDYHFRNKDL